MSSCPGSNPRCRRPASRGAPARRRRLATWFGLLALLAGCRDREAELAVDPAQILVDRSPPRASELRFAIGTMISPRETLVTYARLAAYLGERLGHPTRIVQKASYGETNDLLLRGEVDFAFVCSGAYVAAHPRGVDLVAVPVIRGEPTYQSYVLVGEESPARGLGDLHGSSVAFVDPLSFTGHLYLASQVPPLDERGAPFFASTTFSRAHTTSVDLLARRRVQVAPVDSLIFEDLADREPARVKGIRVLHRSPRFGAPPFVARPGLPDTVRLPLRRLLLGMHEEPAGRAVLRDLAIDRFTLAEDRAYDGIRHLRGLVTVAADGGRAER